MLVAYDYLIFISQKYGGVSRYFYEIIKRLSHEEEHKVHLYSGMHINEYIKNIPKNKIRNIGFYFPKSKSKIRTTLSPLITKFCTLNADVYHSTYYYMSSLNRKNFKTKICTAYDMIHEKYPQYFSNSNETTLIKKSAFEISDHIISISESTKNDLIYYFNVPESKIKVIHLGSEFPVSENEKPLFNFPYILYAGQRNGYKNFMNFLKAFSINSFLTTNFSIIAFGGGDFSKEENALIHKLKLQDKVQHINGNDEHLANLYSHASLFVYPSLYEGFGLPPLEAMRNKCVVAVSNTSSIPEVVGYAGIYFDPLSIDDISAKMELGLSDSALRKQLVLKGLSQMNKFSWNNCYTETLNLYQSCSK
jgi:glycosyltransferase involved in cell wall biosynthesis